MISVCTVIDLICLRVRRSVLPSVLGRGIGGLVRK